MSSARTKGTLKKWFEDKGYGFIAPEKGSKDVFIHISAFERGLPRGPQAGDTIFYHITTDKNGKTKAVEATIEGVSPVKRVKYPKQNYTPRGRRTSNWRFLILCLVLIIGAGSMLYNRLQSNGGGVINFMNKSNKSTLSSRFTCSGKTHCSQMTSCEEAKFYLQNCPNTKMDGDGDGIPCERQLCN